LLLVLVSLLLCVVGTPFDVPVGMDKAATLVNALQTQFYNVRSGLWDTTGWWNSANSLEALIEYTMYAKDESYEWVVENTFKLTTIEQTLNGEYDDEQWWALGWLKAYELTKDEKYLSRAVILWNDIYYNAWDNVCGGGVWLNFKKEHKNAIVNELFLALSMRLYYLDRPSNTRNETYRQSATAEWEWFKKSGMINKQNLINEGLDSKCQNNGGVTWTYTQGVLLGGLASLINDTKDTKTKDDLITLGKNILSAVMATLVYNSGVLRETCEINTGPNPCGEDAPQYKGIFLRYMGIFINTLDLDPPDKLPYVLWVNLNAETIWTAAKAANNECGLIWVGPLDQVATAATQTSVVDCFNTNVLLSPKGA